MNPYNPPYNFPQQTSGPPQPPWKAPPRSSGWADPRFPTHQQQSPVSPPYNTSPNVYGTPLPHQPPPPPPPPPPFDTATWGVRYNQEAAQQYGGRPALPPRPSNATNQISPRTAHAGVNYSSHQAPPPSAGVYHAPQPSQHYPTAWSDSYPSNPPSQPSTFTAPPAPPPRPPEYQAQIQAHHNRVNSPHLEYSHRPPSHHYDVPLQNAWGAQPVPSTAPTYHPTAPVPQQISATVDGPRVSPLESNSGNWGVQEHSAAGRTAHNNAYQAPLRTDGQAGGHAQALSYGGLSDWEHYEPDRPPDDASASPLARPEEHHHQAQGPVSPTQSHALQEHRPNAPGPVTPVEVGVASPMSPRRRSSHARHPSSPPVETSQSPLESKSSFSDRIHGGTPTHEAGGSNYDTVSQPSNAPPQTPSFEEEASRPAPHSPDRVRSPEPPATVKVVDPYADLAPEFRASLNRYASMLRREAAAETDEEKFRLFQAFVQKELRLRSLLYGVELDREPAESKKAASLADVQAILPNAIEVMPLARDGHEAQKVTESVAAAMSKPPSPQPSVKEESSQPSPATVTDLADQKQPQPEPPVADATHVEQPTQRPSLSIEVEQPSRLKDENMDGGNADPDVEEEAYSPGGRPRIGRIPPNTSGTAKSSTTTTPTPEQGSRQSPDYVSSQSADAPMVIEDYVTANPPSPGMNAPILVMSESPPETASAPQDQKQKPVAPFKFEPARPAYTPFRYSAAVQDERPKSLQPADQAYSTLRHSVADSGRLMVQEPLFTPARPSSAIGRKEHEEAFIGLIRKQSMAARQKTPGATDVFRRGENFTKSEPPLAIRVGTPINVPLTDPLEQAITALRALLPSDPSLNAPQNPQLETIKRKIDAVPDQFGYIRETVVEWDRTNREIRKQQDAERSSRQEESEAHVDALFNDNEIGYADIGVLEAEFKLAEAERRYLEHKQELESFTAQVFAPVTERLEKEIAELTTAYTLAMDLLDLESASASQYLRSNKKKALMSEVMSCLLVLFNKIEVRYRKVAEAHVERERRRKRLELTVLYTNGDTAGVKRLEKDFATAEKTQVLHEAREKDNRANKLMDAFDRATVRGLGDNQMLIDDLLARLLDLKTAISAAGPSARDKLHEADGLQDTLSLAQQVVDAVLADSRKILALSNEAEVMLNDADYEVSVAEARVVDAEKTTYRNLETEKAKEDAKLSKEMLSRISSVTKGPSDAIALIRELSDDTGDDSQHQERIRKALEAAKKRNASTPPGPPSS